MLTTSVAGAVLLRLTVDELHERTVSREEGRAGARVMRVAGGTQMVNLLGRNRRQEELLLAVDFV